MLIVKLPQRSSSDPQDPGLQPVVNPPCWASRAAASRNLTMPYQSQFWRDHLKTVDRELTLWSLNEICRVVTDHRPSTKLAHVQETRKTSFTKTVGESGLPTCVRRLKTVFCRVSTSGLLGTLPC